VYNFIEQNLQGSQKEYEKDHVVFGMTVGAMGDQPVENGEETKPNTVVKDRVCGISFVPCDYDSSY